MMPLIITTQSTIRRSGKRCTRIRASTDTYVFSSQCPRGSNGTVPVGCHREADRIGGSAADQLGHYSLEHDAVRAGAL